MKTLPRLAWPLINRWGLAGLAVVLVLMFAVAGSGLLWWLLRTPAEELQGGPPNNPPAKKPPDVTVERIARFEQALADVAAGKIDRRELRVSFSFDGKGMTRDGKGSGSAHGNGPGQLGLDRPFTLTQPQQDELLQLLTEFPWQEIPQSSLGDVGKSHAAMVGVDVRLREWSKAFFLWVNEPQPSLFDARGKPEIDKVTRLTGQIRRLMEAAPRAENANDMDDALTRIADGKLPAEFLNVHLRYVWKIQAKKDGLIPKIIGVAHDTEPVADRTDGWGVNCDGPFAWAPRSPEAPVLMLSAKECLELATFLKEIRATELHKNLERVPQEKPRVMRYRRAGHGPERRWKTQMEFGFSYMDHSFFVDIQDVEELPADQRQPYERLLQRFKPLHDRLVKEGKAKTHT